MSNPAITSTEVTEDDMCAIHVLPTSLLAAIARGEIDALAMVRQELADRGLDETGKWIGFKR